MEDKRYFKSSLLPHLGGRVLIPSSFVCLFWLSDDCSEVIRTEGEVEFTNSDMVAKRTIDPKGMHDNYVKDSYNYNRGKISLIGGRVDLSVGKGFSKKTVSMIKDYFGISNFNVNVYETMTYDK